MITRGTNLPRVKKKNEALIKEIIYKYAPISRGKIAEMLFLTPPTITTNVASLMEKGLICECVSEDDPSEHSLGRKPVNIDFVRNARFAVGIELNPYCTAIVILNLRGEAKIRKQFPAMNCGYEEAMERIAVYIEEVIKESGVDTKKILGVGVGVPGFVETRTGTLRESFKQEWNHKNVAADLVQRLKMQVVLENNARVRAVGEELFGKTMRAESFVYYLISYGIACPLFVKNRMIIGEKASAGEAGHMVVDIHGPKCETCGHVGCLEEMASERAILKKCRMAVQNGTDTILRELCSDPSELTMQEILLAEKRGDSFTGKVIEEAIMYLGVALANIINLIGPPLVIVDGYIMSIKKNRKQLLEETRKHIFGLNEQEIEFAFIDFDLFTGAKGGAALAIKQFFIKEETMEYESEKICD